MNIKERKLKDLLEKNYLAYKRIYSSRDPVWNLHKFSNNNDIEVIGLITSCFAYGQVDQMNKFISALLSKIGNKPYEFTINFRKHKDTKYLEGLFYRFNNEQDLVLLFENLSRQLKKFSTLQELFLKVFRNEDDNIIPAAINFVKSINHKNSADSSYYRYLLPNPENGSTCKRLFLFLRWMVRKDEIDMGTWRRISPSKLIMPVDTHIYRISRRIGIMKRRSQDLKFAVELTNKLKIFDPDDPVKYDFSLCHIGIDKKEI